MPRRRASTLSTIVVVVLYVAIIGAPIPAVRSATMLDDARRDPARAAPDVAMGDRRARRGAAACSIPRVVLDAGYQLSVVGVAAMISAAQLAQTHRRAAASIGRARAVAVTLLGTTVATIASAPIVAWVFGRVSLVAPLTNLAANPLIALAQPMVFCGMVLAPIRSARDASSPTPRIRCSLDSITSRRSARRRRAASIAVAPTSPARSIAAVLSVAVIVACASARMDAPRDHRGRRGRRCSSWLPFVPRRVGATSSCT